GVRGRGLEIFMPAAALRAAPLEFFMPIAALRAGPLENFMRRACDRARPLERSVPIAARRARGLGFFNKVAARRDLGMKNPWPGSARGSSATDIQSLAPVCGRLAVVGDRRGLESGGLVGPGLAGRRGVELVELVGFVTRARAT